MEEDNVLSLNDLTDIGSPKHKSLPGRGRRVHSSVLRIHLLGLLLLLLQTSVEAEQVLIWSQHSHLWTKLRGIYGQTNQWLQQHRKNFMTSESTRDQILDSLAYDHRTSYVYWHDKKTRSFYRQKVDDSLKRRSTATEKVYESTSGDIGGMAIDWLTGNVFWTERALNQIRMTTKHPTSTDLVRVVTQGLIDPTNIAVDPVNVRLYWGEGGNNPRIMTSDMEGGDKRPLTQPNQVRKIVSLTLDLSDSTIYFVDEDIANSISPMVKKLDLRTSTVSNVMTLNGRKYPGIAAHKDYIFLVDADFLEVQVYSKTDGNLIYNYVIDAFPHDIVISDTLDPRWNPPTTCDQLNCGDFCIRLITGEAQCRCRDKYYFRLDKRSCISSIPRFIYGMDGHLWDATADIASEFNVAELTPKLLTGQRQFQVIEAVGYHFTKDFVFFSDTGTNDIFRMEVEKKSLVQITANEYRVEGITVCWMSDTLYWTDSELRHVMLSKLDGRYHRQLLTNVGRPRGITCDALHGYLFFAEAEGNTIERVYTDGTNREIVVKDALDPQSIVVDPRSEKIFWTQGFVSQIYTADLLGNNKATVMQTSSMPYGVTLFQDFVVWTQNADHPKIGSKVNGQHLVVNVQGQSINFPAQKTRDIVTFDHFLQPGQLGPCVANGGCKQLCFVTPNGQKCGCAIGYTLDNDGKSCNTVLAETQFVLFVDPFHKAIYQYDTKSKKTHAVPMNNIDFPTSMDVEPSTGKIVYIDDMKRAIKSSYTNGAGAKDLWKYPDDREPKKVAYYPGNKMIYFIDGYPGKGGLYALPKDGGEPKPVVPNLIRPTAVAVDSKSGMIYYSVAGNQGSEAMIGSVNVDGTGGRIVANFEVQDPTDLAVLPDENMLFWSEMSGQIWIYNMTDQQPPKKLMEDRSKKILSISADDTLVYISAYGTKAVFSLEWKAPAPQLQYATESIYARIYDIKAYPDIRLIPPPLPVVAAIPFMWIGVGIAAVVLLGLLLLLALCFSRKKPKKKSPKRNGVPGPAPPVVSASEEVEWGDIGHTNATIHANGGMSNGYHDEPDYQNFANGHPADIPVTTSAPVLNSPPENGFDSQNLANAALVVASTGQLKKTDRYKKNEKQPPPPPVQPSFETNQKMSTMVERLAKRLRTGISSIRWTNGERDQDSRGSQPPEDIENQGDPDADPVGANKPKYAKRPPIGPFKPQLHRLPQGFAPASRVVPSNVKNTWGRNKKNKRGAPQGGDS